MNSSESGLAENCTAGMEDSAEIDTVTKEEGPLVHTQIERIDDTRLEDIPESTPGNEDNNPLPKKTFVFR